jgi:CubicO group peptidase (beta-lactamase class C family)
MRILYSLLLTLLLAAPALPQVKPTEADLARKIKDVETSLTPAFQVAGEPATAFGLADRMRHYKVPAVSIAVIHDGKIEWARAYGYVSNDSLQKADTATLFQAASISKPLAALAALKLVEQGKLGLEDDVNAYLKSWKVNPSPFMASRPVTLRGLLTHTAGLTVHGFRGYAPGEPLPSTGQILNGEKPANSAAVAPDAIPGSRWRYSGGGYVVIQQMVEDATGVDFPTFLQQQVLFPAGMRHSTFQQPLPAERQGQASRGHLSNGKKIAGGWYTYPEMAAAGLWTTPSDLARYILEVQQSLAGKSNKVLSRVMTARMLTREPAGRMGLGPEVNGEKEGLLFSHGGANVGYRCELQAFARAGRGVVVMTNSDNGGELIREIVRSVSKVYGWGTFNPVTKKRAKLTVGQLQAFAGTYAAGQSSLRIEVTAGENALLLRQLWDQRQVIVYPESELRFFTREEGLPVTFKAASDGTISSLVAFGRLHMSREE